MLEESLEAFQNEVEASLAGAGTLLKRLKKLRAAAVAGDLREVANLSAR